MRAGAPAPAVALARATAALTLLVAPAALSVEPAAAALASARRAHAATPPSRPSSAARQVVGGTQLASRGVIVNYPATGVRRLPKVPASAYVIADANTGQVLAAKDPHGEFAPASTLKMLTAVTLIPRLKPDAMVLATRRATSVEPNVVGLIRGHRYRVADLFRALLLISANDAAVALTEATGSFQQGISLINAQAQQLQAYDVVAKQPNGLPAAGQVVSAYDEALIARQALAIPAFMRYDSTRAARFKVKHKHWVTLVNQNTLLTQYRGGIGGKIGWTVKSKATYVGMARRHGVTLIVTVLHCKPLEEITSGERLLNWGFAMAGRIQPVGTLVPPRPAGAQHASKPAQTAASAAAGTVRLGNAAQATSSHGAEDAGLAIAAAVVTLGVLASLVRSRRRHAPAGRHRPDR